MTCAPALPAAARLAAACLLCVCAAPAFAAGPNAVFSCNTDAFTVFSTGSHFVVQGKIDAPHPAYTYDASALETGTDGVARGVLTFHAPQALEEGEKDPSLPPTVPLAVEAAFLTPTPASRIVIKLDKPFMTGPREIDCVQVGGAQ